MARINSLDSIEFFGFEEGQSLPGAMAEAAAFLRSNHPDLPELDSCATSGCDQPAPFVLAHARPTCHDHAKD